MAAGVPFPPSYSGSTVWCAALYRNRWRARWAWRCQRPAIRRHARSLSLGSGATWLFSAVTCQAMLSHGACLPARHLRWGGGRWVTNAHVSAAHPLAWCRQISPTAPCMCSSAALRHHVIAARLGCHVGAVHRSGSAGSRSPLCSRCWLCSHCTAGVPAPVALAHHGHSCSAPPAQR